MDIAASLERPKEMSSERFRKAIRSRITPKSIRTDGKHRPEYLAFRNARRRCTEPSNRGWKYYGGRGIEFRFSSFAEFMEELGDKPSPRHSLDRIDNDGHYERGNVRWATMPDQSRNRRNCCNYSLSGESHTAPEWCAILGMNRHTFHTRLYLKNWPIEKVLTTPVKRIKQRSK